MECFALRDPVPVHGGYPSVYGSVIIIGAGDELVVNQRSDLKCLSFAVIYPFAHIFVWNVDVMPASIFLRSIEQLLTSLVIPGTSNCL
jgi:hypothetical protein